MTTYLSPNVATPRRSTSTQRRSLSRERDDQTIVTAIPPPSAAAPKRDTSAHRHSRHISLDSLARFVQTLGHQSISRTGHEIVNPHFDLVESPTAYTVYGELPGLDRDGVNIEVNDAHFTMTVSGLLWRPTPAGAGAAGAATNGATAAKADMGATTSHIEYGGAPAAEPRGRPSGDTKREPAVPRAAEGSGGELHWHITERRVGEFRRAFHFPFEMAQMNRIRATMQQGLLTVTVPKRAVLPEEVGKPKKARKLEVEVAAAAGGETTTGVYPTGDFTVGAVL